MQEELGARAIAEEEEEAEGEGERASRLRLERRRAASCESKSTWLSPVPGPALPVRLSRALL